MIYVVILILIVIVAIISIYNELVKIRKKVENAWSQIDVQLQRRVDLIPNLVETVKGYMINESELLNKVTELRTSWIATNKMDEKALLDSKLTETLRVVIEGSDNYTDLKVNPNFIEMKEELKNIENKIAYLRQFYNDTVVIYNTKLENIPFNVITSIFHIKSKEPFKVKLDEIKKNLKADF